MNKINDNMFVYAYCPFLTKYRKENTITCEKEKMIFKNEDQKYKHFNKYCSSDNYIECETAKALMKKYK